MAILTRFETWVCRRAESPGTYPDDLEKARSSHGSEYIVIRLSTDEGTEGTATALAAYSPDISLTYLNEIIAPVVLGRDVYDREAIWQELFDLNRRLAFFPLHLPGPVDVALWDIAAKQANLPLYKYLGAYRESLPVYASSQFHSSTERYVEEAGRYLDLGITAYKAHPSGDWRRHIEISRALRDTYPGLVLMLDPGGVNYSLNTAIAVGRELEKLEFYFLEEPFHEHHISNYVELRRHLDIPICATEATAGGPAGVAEFIKAGAVDIVRADVSWKWGVTGTLKIMHLAEAFGLNCELHTTMMGPMDIANLHIACAARNSEYFELFTPHELWRFPMVEQFDVDSDGSIHVPHEPGLGVTVNWDTVDDDTLKRLEWKA